MFVFIGKGVNLEVFVDKGEKRGEKCKKKIEELI